MTDLLVILAVAAGTYAFRVSFIAVAGARTFPPLVERLMGQLKPAVFAAMIGTSLVAHQALDPVHGVALAAAALVARTRRGLLGALVAGLIALPLLQLLTGS